MNAQPTNRPPTSVSTGEVSWFERRTSASAIEPATGAASAAASQQPVRRPHPSRSEIALPDTSAFGTNPRTGHSVTSDP